MTDAATLRGQVAEMTIRSLRKAFRQPAMIVPSIAFPLILMAVNVAGLQSATKLPGFPTDSYLDFAMAFAFLQGSLFAMINAGTVLAGDVESGFLKRLALTPMQRPALLLGNLAGVLAVVAISTLTFLVIGFSFGLEIKSGAGGLVVLIALQFLISTTLAAVGAWIGLRTGSAQAVQGFFPLAFVLFFLSSMNLPRDLIAQDWFRTIATYNPVSYLIEALRSLIITGWDWEALALGTGIALALLALALWGASRALRSRLVRT